MGYKAHEHGNCFVGSKERELLGDNDVQEEERKDEDEIHSERVAQATPDQT